METKHKGTLQDLPNYENARFRTICAVHREMYQCIVSTFPDDVYRQIVLEKLGEAYDMGVRMNDRLKKYSEGSWKGQVFELNDKRKP